LYSSTYVKYKTNHHVEEYIEHPARNIESSVFLRYPLKSVVDMEVRLIFELNPCLQRS